MVTRAEWYARLVAAYTDETCVSCGRAVHITDVDDEGNVWAWCHWCYQDRLIGHEPIPTTFTEEPAADDLPF